jgi:DNA topoisomerase VI subunit B
MYGMLTTGKPVKIVSMTSPKKLAHYFEIRLCAGIRRAG